jgi:hypothetical protein
VPLKDVSDMDIKYLIEGESLVIERVFNIQVKKDDLEQQRKNIFHTRCHSSNKICSIIINSESCANISNTTCKIPHRKRASRAKAL